jgi:hypothetical protein
VNPLAVFLNDLVVVMGEEGLARSKIAPKTPQANALAVDRVQTRSGGTGLITVNRPRIFRGDHPWGRAPDGTRIWQGESRLGPTRYFRMAPFEAT